MKEKQRMEIFRLWIRQLRREGPIDLCDTPEARQLLADIQKLRRKQQQLKKERIRSEIQRQAYVTPHYTR